MLRTGSTVGVRKTSGGLYRPPVALESGGSALPCLAEVILLEPMETSTPSKKLFHVLVVVGMGAAATGCSSSSSSGGTTVIDSGTAANDAEQSTDSSEAVDSATSTGDSSSTAVDSGTSVSEAGMTGDSCAGWAPCC